MHLEILSKEQLELFPLIKEYQRTFYVVGGTAIALHIGHRKSIDYDMFKFGKLNRTAIFDKINKYSFPTIKSFIEFNQINIVCNSVKMTFFSFPYQVPSEILVEKTFKIPTLIDLASMKAFALGRRAKWKDYVDLYFIIKNFYSIEEISNRAKELFGDDFIPKQFRGQLGYFGQMNYSEEVEFLIPNPPSDEEIKQFLMDESIRF
jgi:hypothetical protein